ncbi:thioredoxin Y2, chloroplastic-like [Andrographis paniculata]|uniref:thioredoxin Y2, chloroplastic-like n=1 Tax=Andrographis paniculata TaxID=175694 RepID=UPI0021E7B16E|nr:thioredoxin Y2, chloroplastic-like [Andrographis paniculata]
MSISVPAALLPTIVAKTSPFSSSTDSRLVHFSSLKFPTNLRISGNRNRCLKSKPRYRTLTLVASKKQTFSSFDDLLEKSDKPVLVDFYATWCGPCQFMVPILEQVSALIGDKIKVVKLDTEKYPTIANKYSIEALPTFILFKDGKPFDRFEGAMNADQLIQRIETSLQVKK